ncbi:TAXI family TRAP transporter solute-binding subunit [Natronorubrum halophilum]|uniref:TAXI family TRAP transporter solute-binding subunit n=1 Tax=Natronorubrum halophilum TaxID=1702106 RepID=UPI0010C1D56A|nr:TAXI family TRAP transporter solute-binding subunit [Natronorubrum halophilum]
MVSEPSASSSGKTRRSFLAATGVGTALALAGCTGSNGETTVRMRTSTSETTAYGANQGIADAVNDQSDDLFVEAQTSQGTEANLGALNNEEAEMVYIQNWSAQEVREGADSFAELEFEMTQVFHFYDLPWFFITDEDLETLSDIEPGMTVSPTPEGSGTAPALERALEHAVDDYDRGSATYGEQGNQMNENQLDVGVGTLMNFGIVPGWLDEIAGSVDDLRVLDISDETAEAWAGDDRILDQTVDTGVIDNADTPGEIPAPTFAYNFIARNDLDRDTVYNFLEAMYAQREELGEYHAVLGTFENEAFWVDNMYDDVPFHEGAADFYEDNDMWSDDFVRADE